MINLLCKKCGVILGRHTLKKRYNHRFKTTKDGVIAAWKETHVCNNCKNVQVLTNSNY